MGIDAGDFDNDGDEDLFITNWLAQMNILYVNDGKGAFEDRKAASGLGPPSLAKTGFGTAWWDYDNDSWLDLLTLNGSVSIIEAQARANDPFPLKMPNQLYRNLGNGRFEDVSAQAGAVFSNSEVSRGGAFGDIDNDGDVDVVVGTAAGPTRLLINNVGNRNGWVGLRLLGATTKRDMLGAQVRILRDGGTPLLRRARSDGSYASANDPRVLVGLGPSAPAAVRVQVVWPDGRTEEWSSVPTGRWTTLTRGKASDDGGRAAASRCAVAVVLAAPQVAGARPRRRAPRRAPRQHRAGARELRPGGARQPAGDAARFVAGGTHGPGAGEGALRRAAGGAEESAGHRRPTAGRPTATSRCCCTPASTTTRPSRPT